MGYEQPQQPTTEEINLVRLLRRLEKTVANEEEWSVHDEVPAEEVMLRVRKTGQTVKFARRLVKTVEIECEDTPVRSKRLNDAKIQLNRMDKFLNELQHSLEPKLEKAERVSLLSTLPVPVPKANVTASSEKAEKMATQQLSIIPPDPDELSSSSVISTALPSLLPINGSESAKSSGFSRTFDAGVRKSNQSTAVVHEELSSQLEQMARQLKRNAIHFSTRLGNDKAVIEDAGMKIERNFEVMEGHRVKLRDRTRTGWKNTCMVVGISVGVVVVFMMVIMVIRIS